MGIDLGAGLPRKQKTGQQPHTTPAKKKKRTRPAAYYPAAALRSYIRGIPLAVLSP